MQQQERHPEGHRVGDAAELKNFTISRRSPTIPDQGEGRERRYQSCAWASQSHRGQRGTPRVPRREQMMGEDGLSSLQTHLQEVAQPVQAHGQGQRMGERPTPPTTVQARSSTPRSCRSSRPEQKMRSRGRSKLKLSLKVMDYINHLNEQVKKETFTHKITMPSAVKENHHQRLFLSERQT